MIFKILRRGLKTEDQMEGKRQTKTIMMHLKGKKWVKGGGELEWKGDGKPVKELIQVKDKGEVHRKGGNR
jgi:hypothetical protein